MRQSPVFFVLIFFLIPVLFASGDFEKSVAQLQERLQTVKGKEKIDTLNRLASHFYKRRPGLGAQYAQQALELAEREGDSGGKAVALIYLANALRALGKTKEPFMYAREALRMNRTLGKKIGIIQSLNTLGYLYLSINNYNEALKSLVEGLELSEEMGLQGMKSAFYYQLGNLHSRLKDHEKALANYLEAYKIVEGKGSPGLAAAYLNNIGIAYRDLGHYRRALEYFEKSLGIYSEFNDPAGVIAATGNIGITYGHLGDSIRALEFLERAVKGARENRNKKRVCDNLTYIGLQYFKLRDYERAVEYYERALGIAREITDNNSIKTIYGYLADLYIAAEEYKKALESYIKFSELKEQQAGEKIQQQLIELQERYESEKKAREIEVLTRDNQIQKITRNAFIAGFILVLVILVIVFKKYLYLFAFWKKQKYIGQYRLVERIGSGGMSTVYKAHSIREKNRIVAIKILKEELSRKESNRRRFKQEGTIIDKLDHPNIIKIYERGESHGLLFIVMEFLEGITLAEKKEKEGALDLEECLQIMKQMTHALAFIHRAGIVHRDLKPENIMVVNGSVVKLLDFGLSKMKFQSRITMTGMLVGTASYMAPEQITELESSPASDVFNLGLIFYEMLAGQPAFSGDSLTQIQGQILDAVPPGLREFRPGIPGELDDLVGEMLAKNPVMRPPADEVSLRLDF